jgi:hypothetical protein
MKIIIDIEDYCYDALQEMAKAKDNNIGYYHEVILNGIPIRKGKWEKETFDLGANFPLRVAYQCSECREYLNFESKYCPNCGTEMETEN